MTSFFLVPTEDVVAAATPDEIATASAVDVIVATRLRSTCA